ncbi:MAG: hypothetical protein WDA18_03390 [Candidatus Ratteibacteria bacterium]|jgi:tetratricopeptide (TPR) repeat protein
MTKKTVLNKEECIIVQKEITILREILKKRPDCIEVLLALADAYVETGDYQASLEIDSKIVQLNPHEPIGYYNLSCDFSALGMIENAYSALFTSVVFGFRDFVTIRQDPDLRNLREDRRYEQFYIQLRRFAAETE